MCSSNGWICAWLREKKSWKMNWKHWGGSLWSCCILPYHAVWTEVMPHSSGTVFWIKKNSDLKVFFKPLKAQTPTSSIFHRFFPVRGQLFHRLCSEAIKSKSHNHDLPSSPQEDPPGPQWRAPTFETDYLYFKRMICLGFRFIVLYMGGDLQNALLAWRWPLGTW